MRIERIVKRFGEMTAVDQVSLDIYKGEIFSLLGGSGSGKTTLLRMLAGFEQPDEGRIFIDGVDMSSVPPYARPVNMMFQSYALFPHMSVEGNIAFGLRQDGVRGRELRERVAEALKLVRLEKFGRRRPHQLSGGQRQRVALARSLVKRPKLLLLDEPLAALDKKLREATQFELVNIQESVGVTFIMVTHDQEEAMTMSSRIAVMEHGYIAQVGTPTEIYEYPATRSVAEFVGQVNLFEGQLLEGEADYTLIDSPQVGGRILIDRAADVPPAATVIVAIRPEKMVINKEPLVDLEAGAPNVLKGRVLEIAYLGDMSIYVVQTPTGHLVRVTAPNRHRLAEMPITWDEEVYVTWPAYAGVVLTQ